jgi:hypothetical protein
MRVRYFAVLCVALVLVVSCTGNAKKDAAGGGSDIEAVVDNRSEEEIVTDLILAHEKKRFNGIDIPVTYLAKVNLGVPGGDNWLAEITDVEGHYIRFYLIKDRAIITKDWTIGWNDNKYEISKFDIMRDIPGTHINDGICSYGDFNGDGLDELFYYGFGGIGDSISIKGYSVEEDKIVNYCGTSGLGIPFGLIDQENGPAPVEFMAYKGKEGFKVHYFSTYVGGGPSDPPEQANPNNRKWMFYTWDAAAREYIEVGEVEEE